MRNVNADIILAAMNERGVDYLLIGGVNFMLRHEAVLTFDIDLWIEDTEANLARCEQALAALGAEWGESDETWQPVSQKQPGWLSRQMVYSLNSPHGAINIFRAVTGLPDWASSRKTAVREATGAGSVYYGISDRDMLACQFALEADLQKQYRIQSLQRHLGEANE